MLNIVCINAGNYQGCGADYIDALYNSIVNNCTVDFNFTCFTDDESLYASHIVYSKLPERNLTGWWNKVSLFKRDVFRRGDRVLYLDLSAIPRKNIDALATDTTDFVMVQPFGASGPFGGLQSSVMAWTVSESTEAIWTAYEYMGKPQDIIGGDQVFIEDFAHWAVTWENVIPGSVRSWKWREDGDDPMVHVFHGNPKPHTLPGWPDNIADCELPDVMAPAEFVDVCNTNKTEIIDHIRENAWRDIPRVRSRIHGAVVVGGGMSASSYVGEIADKQRDGAAVFALNGSAQWLRVQGIQPDFHVLLDARRDNITFLSHAMANDPAGWRKTVHLLSAQCHPDLFSFLCEHGADVRLWHVDVGDEATCEVKAKEPHAHLFSVGTTVGLSVLNLILAMGYRRADLYGYDSSNAGEDHHAYPQALNDTALTDEYFFGGKAYQAPRAMASQAKQFVDIYQRLEESGLALIVHGTGLLPDMWRHEEKERAASQSSLEAKEAYKYRRCWAYDAYREWSDGENLVGRAVELLIPDDHVRNDVNLANYTRFIDFGCGSGRATARLASMGYEVLGIDHASNSLNQDVHIPFCVANLWALPDNIPQADYGYCVDVMEHITEEKIDDVLENIKRLCKRSVFFKIDHEDAIFGSIIGVGDLHQTIRGPDWWREKLARHFPGVRHSPQEGWFICYNGSLVSGLRK